METIEITGKTERPLSSRTRSKIGPRVHLELKKISSDMNKWIDRLFREGGGSGCRDKAAFIDMLIYYGCQNYEFRVMPAERGERTYLPSLPEDNEQTPHSGRILIRSDRFGGKRI